MGVIIRAHIHIEHQLIEFIQARLSPPEALDALEIGYSGRLRLALALGLPMEFKPALSFIGRLRNRFAHRLDALLGKEDADNFEAALGSGKDIAYKSYLQTKEKLGQSAFLIEPLEPKERMILYFVTLWSGVAVAAAKAKSGD